MVEFPYLPQLTGGAVIGIASSLLMLGIGRVAGISGIVRGVFVACGFGERGWRLLFLVGLVTGGAAGVAAMADGLAPITFRWPLPVYIAAGLLVGVGTGLANGCTSGHGVCGAARFAPRSLAANAIYLGVGSLIATLINTIQ